MCKKLVTIILIIFLTGLTPLYSVGEVEAAAATGIFSGMVGKAVLGTLLSSMGIEYFDVEAMLAQSWNIWGRLPAHVKTAIEDKVVEVEENLSAGELVDDQYISVTQEEFNSFRDAVLELDEYLVNNPGEDIEFEETMQLGELDAFNPITINAGGIFTGEYRATNRYYATFPLTISFKITGNEAIRNQVISFDAKFGSPSHIQVMQRVKYSYSPELLDQAIPESTTIGLLGEQIPFMISVNRLNKSLSISVGNYDYVYADDPVLEDIYIGKIGNADYEASTAKIFNAVMTMPSTWNINQDDYFLNRALAQNPAYDISGLLISISSLLENVENIIGMQAGSAVTDIPAPSEGEQPEDVLGWLGVLGGLLGHGTKSISSWLGDIWQGQKDAAQQAEDRANAIPEDMEIEQTIDSTVNSYLNEKLPLAPMSSTLAKLENFNVDHGEPPKWTINLNAMALSSRYISMLSSDKKIFEKDEYTLLDFAMLQDYKYMNISIIELIRSLIAFNVIYTTLLYVWNAGRKDVLD